MTDDLRTFIRRTRTAKLKAERERAAALSVGLKDPAPSQTVMANIKLADEQRFLASQAKDRNLRKKYETSATLYDRKAETAWKRQLEQHWQFLALGESMELEAARAAGRGDKDGGMEMAATEVADWARDHHGAIVRDEKGLPVLAIERADAPKRRDGLQWLYDKERISEAQYRTAKWFRQVCSDYADATGLGVADDGSGRVTRSKPSPGPADWKLKAITDYQKACEKVRANVPPLEGAEMLRVCIAVCHEGRTVRELALNNDWEARCLEEKFKFGLALLAGPNPPSKTENR